MLINVCVYAVKITPVNRTLSCLKYVVVPISNVLSLVQAYIHWTVVLQRIHQSRYVRLGADRFLSVYVLGSCILPCIALLSSIFDYNFFFFINKLVENHHRIYL